MTIYGAYTHARPDGSVFYVGKGSIKRAKWMKRNKLHGAIVEKYGAKNIIVSFIPCSSENIAFDLEIGLIKCFRKMSVKLVNLTDGGEGVSGFTPSPETRAKMSVSSKASRTIEVRAKISAASKGIKKSPEFCAKISAAKSGKKRPPEFCEKMSISLRGRVVPDETRIKISQASKGKKKSTETRLKMSLAQRRIAATRIGRKLSPESIIKREITKALNREKNNASKPSTL